LVLSTCGNGNKTLIQSLLMHQFVDLAKCGVRSFCICHQRTSYRLGACVRPGMSCCWRMIIWGRWSRNGSGGNKVG